MYSESLRKSQQPKKTIIIPINRQFHKHHRQPTRQQSKQTAYQPIKEAENQPTANKWGKEQTIQPIKQPSAKKQRKHPS